jgi:hypothetical protein
VPEIWEAKQHDFFFTIELWNKGHGNDWSFTKGRLPEWLRALRAKRFDWGVWRTWNQELINLEPGKIEFMPVRIHACKHEEETILNQEQPQSEDDLVNLLVSRVKWYAEIVSSLGK